MKKLFLLACILLCSCALISTDDHSEVFEKFDKRFPDTQSPSERAEKPDRRF